jgi:peptidoglycan/xylan/chitin deacetylase (PgdA/CDA1 family)
MDCLNNKKKIKLFITIDTEDKYFDTPKLITGEGLENNPGVEMIMNILDKYNYKANFFLNIYEHINYEEDVLKDIAVNIYERGHEIELHTHPNERSSFYKRPIYKYPLEHQVNILEYGKKLIYDWVGESPIAHRGGAYSCNDDTLTALYRVGIPIDSSFWLNNINNIFEKKFTANRVTKYNNVIEVPITYVEYINSNAKHSDSKFDVDWLNIDDLIKVVKQAKENNLGTLTLFLHSFSLIEKTNKLITEKSDPRAIFVSKPCWGKSCAQIMGSSEERIRRFTKILEYIARDSDIEVLTFKEWYNSNSFLCDLGEDYIPVISK